MASPFRPAAHERSNVRRQQSDKSSAARQAAGAVAVPGELGVQAAVTNPGQSSPEQMLQVQRLHGNRAVQGLLKPAIWEKV